MTFTRALMTTSAAAMAGLGLAATFAPAEILRELETAPTLPLRLGVQVLGALYLGFATLNWTAQGSMIGGIYNRPLVLANLLHFVTAGLALLKAALSGASAGYWVAAVGYAVFGVCFALIMFRHPLSGRGEGYAS